MKNIYLRILSITVYQSFHPYNIVKYKISKLSNINMNKHLNIYVTHLYLKQKFFLHLIDWFFKNINEKKNWFGAMTRIHLDSTATTSRWINKHNQHNIVTCTCVCKVRLWIHVYKNIYLHFNVNKTVSLFETL